MDGNWTIIITGLTALGSGTWLGHYLKRHKTAAETEGQSVVNVSMTNVEWKKLYDEMREQVAILRIEVEGLKSDLDKERKDRRVLERQVRRNENNN